MGRMNERMLRRIVPHHFHTHHIPAAPGALSQSQSLRTPLPSSAHAAAAEHAHSQLHSPPSLSCHSPFPFLARPLSLPSPARVQYRSRCPTECPRGLLRIPRPCVSSSLSLSPAHAPPSCPLSRISAPPSPALAPSPPSPTPDALPDLRPLTLRPACSICCTHPRPPSPPQHPSPRLRPRSRTLASYPTLVCTRPAAHFLVLGPDRSPLRLSLPRPKALPPSPPSLYLYLITWESSSP
ncbi:hypothetical protein OH77DRAFT_40984 [Trametes cingulata]|nr:hypothetical protein OH77DRAFT_40984 [Trametes cingulata]